MSSTDYRKNPYRSSQSGRIGASSSRSGSPRASRNGARTSSASLSSSRGRTSRSTIDSRPIRTSNSLPTAHTASNYHRDRVSYSSGSRENSYDLSADSRMNRSSASGSFQRSSSDFGSRRSSQSFASGSQTSRSFDSARNSRSFDNTTSSRRSRRNGSGSQGNASSRATRANRSFDNNSRGGFHVPLPDLSGISLPSLGSIFGSRRQSNQWGRTTAKGFESGFSSSAPGMGSRGIAGTLSNIFGGIVNGIGALAGNVGLLKVIGAIILVLLVFGFGDHLIHNGKAYGGVTIGGTSVAGMTESEISKMLVKKYGDNVENCNIVVYASEEAQKNQDMGEASAEINEQLDAEEASQNKTAWTITDDTFDMVLPADKLAQEAVAVGRDDGGFFSRIGARLFGHDIDLSLEYDEDKFEALCSDIDKTVGEPLKDYGFTIKNGFAKVTEGHDGVMVNRDSFDATIDRIIFETEDGSGSFVAKAEEASVRIDENGAKKACDIVNRAIGAGATFSCNGQDWKMSDKQLGKLLKSKVAKNSNGDYVLVPYFDETKTKKALLKHVADLQDGDAAFKVTFEKDGDAVLVHTDSQNKMPLLQDTVEALNYALFGEGADGYLGGSKKYVMAAEGPNKPTQTKASKKSDNKALRVEIAYGKTPETMSFEDALAMGVIQEISTYTTEYSTGEGTEERNFNIARVGTFIDNSICKAHDTWSFNGTTGECCEETGFKAAGAIIDGQYTDEFGGGICQMATTVFNCVYEAGLPIPIRSPHSLYSSSYPTGRDAAVSWDELDLVWENSTDSDILLKASTTESTATVTIYGEDPNYTVETVEGTWEQGDTYGTRVIVDSENYGENDLVQKTVGSNGSSISITRYVYDSNGDTVSEDVFPSTYDPMDEIWYAGSEAVASAVNTG